MAQNLAAHPPGRPSPTSNQREEQARKLEAGSEFPGLTLNLEEIWEA